MRTTHEFFHILMRGWIICTTIYFSVAIPAWGAVHRGPLALPHKTLRSTAGGKSKVGSDKPPAIHAAPAEMIAMRAQKVMASLKSRPIRIMDAVLAEPSEVSASAEKGAWVQALYAKNMIDTSWSTEMLSDKRILFEVLERELGSKATTFYPKTMGLREFLVHKRLVDANGRLSADGDRVEAALHEEFPAGFIVRPAVGVAPQETGRGLFPDTDQFIVELFKPDNILYHPSHLTHPVRSHILEAIASGEAVVLQENFIAASDARHPLRNKFFQEVRVHTYETQVVKGAVPERWVQTNLLSKSQIARAEDFVAEFLQSLPPAMLAKQAWGIDVAVLDNGDLRINDVVTNRGKPIAWSGYLDQPRVIAAYSKHFEEHYGLRFKGVSGTLIRHGFANYMPYWEKRIEKARPGWSKALAYLPPMP